MLNPWPIIAAIWIASLAAVGIWQRGEGRTLERADRQERDNEQLRQAGAAINNLNRSARAAEQAHATALARVSTDHQKDLNHAKDQHRRDLAAVRAGTLRLRDPAAPALRAAGRGISAPGPAACRRDDAAPGELSESAAEFLLDLTLDADDTARQLAACQRVVIEDRRMGQ